MFEKIFFSSIIFGVFKLISGQTSNESSFDIVHWGYRNPEYNLLPKNWSDISPKCSGRHQSPINIETASVEYNSALQPLDFSIYDNTFTWKIFETEHNSMQI